MDDRTQRYETETPIDNTRGDDATRPADAPDFDELKQDEATMDLVAQAEEKPAKRLSLRERLAARRAEESDDSSGPEQGKWYVLHTYSGYENKVKKTIEGRVEAMDLADRVYEVVVPTQEEVEIKDGQRKTVQRKVFPGYVLVRMEMDEDTWYQLRNTPGVTGFVSQENKPVPLRGDVATNVIQEMETEAPKVNVSFALGDSVRIIDGPFADFRGEVDEVNNERGKIKVLVSFFGRETPVELDFLQAERET